MAAVIKGGGNGRGHQGDAFRFEAFHRIVKIPFHPFFIGRRAQRISDENQKALPCIGEKIPEEKSFRPGNGGYVLGNVFRQVRVTLDMVFLCGSDHGCS